MTDITYTDLYRLVAWLDKRNFSLTERKLMIELMSNIRPLRSSEIFDALYSDREDGGPLCASIVGNLVARCRKKLRGSGFRILTDFGVGHELAHGD